jgi:hypothetical protein
MKASEMTLQTLLGGPNQYVIPVFQRYYSWRQENWLGLWEDIVELHDTGQTSSRHFMGALVFLAEPTIPGQIPAYQVIDGQQRTITLALLLCALRDVATMRGFSGLASQITNTVLVHPYHSGREHFRVYPRQRDRDQFTAAIEQKAVDEGNIQKALQFFTNEISKAQGCETEVGLRELFNLIVARLDFVAITLQGENPYRIFRSLNSTGVDLSEADLIRNFVFMHVPSSEQDSFDDKRWKVLEQHFFTSEDRLNGTLLSGFFRDFMMSNGKYIPPTSTFQEFENYYAPGFKPSELLDELDLYAQFYDIVRGVKAHTDKGCHAALRKLRRLESSTTYPLILNLMLRVHQGTLSPNDFAHAVSLVASFILRRFVCGESSRAYGRWFVTACTQLGSDPVNGLRGYLKGRGFPSDSRFTDYFLRADLYTSRYAWAVLEALERAKGSKEVVVDLQQATVEHIMPQRLTDDWKAMLGTDADQTHSTWLHTVGNLTLTGYNGELSNHSFEEKKKLYWESNIQLTRDISQASSWTETEIKARGQTLAHEAVKIWIGPDA